MLLGKINALTFTEQSKRYFNLKHFQGKKKKKKQKPHVSHLAQQL